ncbi:MAG: potassium-transporting ATPase subunit F [Chromatiales bacterium]|jgi:K+-transporting ATPase KdpF subunit|nr:potassium-transporting ATPase subunit F [Chromatiales bacterium]
MSTLDTVALLLALGLGIYVAIALLRPEWFE